MCIPIIFWRILLSWCCRGSWGESLSQVEEVTLVPVGYKTTADGKQLPLRRSDPSICQSRCCHSRDAGLHLAQKKPVSWNLFLLRKPAKDLHPQPFHKLVFVRSLHRQ